MTKEQEFRRAWSVLLAAAFGAGVGLSSLLNYTSGLFVKDLGAAIHLSRTQFGLAFFLATVAMAAAMPVIGMMVDRFGPRRPAMFGAAGLSLCYLALGLLTTSVTSYIVLMVLLGVCGSASTTVGFTRAVTSWFEAGRGLALGLTQAGIGIAAIIIPPLVILTINAHGWRSGYIALAAIAALGIVSALGLRLREKPATEPLEGTSEDGFRAVRQSRLFRLQFAAFVGMMLCFSGLLVHFVPILRDMGRPPAEAAGYAAMIGISVLLSRLAIGWLADMVHTPWLAGIATAIGATACLMLASGESLLVPLAAVALGIAMGAELDLLGYLTARHFGLAVYGRAYAWQYGGIVLAAGISPAWLGWMADRTGSYRAGLITSAVLALGVIGLFLALPRSKRVSAPTANRFSS